jgi:hypothetical protein
VKDASIPVPKRDAAWRPVVKVENTESHPSGAKQAAEKRGISGEISENVPQGLKPTLILLHLRHD